MSGIAAKIISTEPGASVDIGAVADTAVTDPTASASVIATLKGLLKQLQGDGSGALPVSTSNLVQWSDAVTLAATNGYSGTGDDLANDSAYDYTDNVDLETDGYDAIEIFFSYNCAGTTDDITISMFSSSDGVLFDNIEKWTAQYSVNGGAAAQISISLADCPPHLRFGVKSGATDTYDYKIEYRLKKIGQTQWADEVVLAATNWFSGSGPDLAADSAYDYTSDVDIVSGGYKDIDVFFEYNCAGTTDDITISMFGSSDGIAFADTPVYSMDCDLNGGVDTQISFRFNDCPPHLRFGVKSGATDTYDYRIVYRLHK